MCAWGRWGGDGGVEKRRGKSAAWEMEGVRGGGRAG